jgi:hypothetical protein
MGRLIPAGTGMEIYRNVRLTEEIVPEEEAVVEQEPETDLLMSSLGLDVLKIKRADAV